MGSNTRLRIDQLLVTEDKLFIKWPSCYNIKANTYIHPIGYLNPWEVTRQIILIIKTDHEGQTLENITIENQKRWSSIRSEMLWIIFIMSQEFHHLFLLYINDIFSVFTDVEFLLFADDLKIYKRITINIDSTCLQSNLNRVYEWCVNNCMDLNIDKCYVVSFHRHKIRPMLSYSIGGNFLSHVDQLCDLRVTFESSLSFSLHIKNICGQSFKLLGFIYRNTKNFKYSNCLKVLFNSLVRSKQEYCSLIWSPHVQHQSDQIERVQNKFLKIIISYKFTSSYNSLNPFNLSLF